MYCFSTLHIQGKHRCWSCVRHLHKRLASAECYHKVGVYSMDDFEDSHLSMPAQAGVGEQPRLKLLSS